MALKYDSFKKKGVKVVALSCNDISSHEVWLKDVVAHCENRIGIDFPMIADPSCSLLRLHAASDENK